MGKPLESKTRRHVTGEITRLAESGRELCPTQMATSMVPNSSPGNLIISGVSCTIELNLLASGKTICGYF